MKGFTGSYIVTYTFFLCVLVVFPPYYTILWSPGGNQIYLHSPVYSKNSCVGSIAC
jgi:hypothetical protein